MRVLFQFAFMALFSVSLGSCARTRNLTKDESDQITDQLKAQTARYARCHEKFGGKMPGAVEVKYAIEYGGAWKSVEIDDEKSSDYPFEMKVCIVEAVRSIPLGVKPKTKVFGTYRIKFTGG